MPSKPDSDGLGRAWVGKLFRPKVTFSAGVPHKAAGKLSLPIGMLYAELLLETTVRIQGNIYVQITQVILKSENQGCIKSPVQLCQKLGSGSYPFLKDGQTTKNVKNNENISFIIVFKRKDIIMFGP